MPAHTIKTIIQTAARAVSFGLNRNTKGNINPSAPNRSTNPEIFTKIKGIWPVQGHMAESASMGWNNLSMLAQIRLHANITWAIHSWMFNDFEIL